MKNVPPSVRAALKRRGAESILEQEGDYETFKPQIDAIIHKDEDMSSFMGDAEAFGEYDDDLSPEEQKANDRIEELGDKYRSKIPTGRDKQLNDMIASLDNARSIDEAYDIEQGIIQLEEQLKQNSIDARPNETKLRDMNLSDSEMWNMAYQYIGTDKLEKLAEKLDLESPQDLRTSDMIKYMSDSEIEDMMRLNGLDDFDEDFEIEKPKYDWKPYNNSDNLDEGGYLRDNEDYKLITKHAEFSPKYIGKSYKKDGKYVYDYDKNQWHASYHDNMGTESESPWFKTREEAQKWAEERYEKGITEITPERIEELAQKYGQSEDITRPSSYDGSPYKIGRTIHTGLTGKEDLEVLHSVIGQLSDGIWENSRAAEKFWKNLKIYRNDDGEIVIDTKEEDWNSPYRDKSPQDVMKYLAQKAKQIVKTEIDDGANAQWDRNSDYQLDYMGGHRMPIKISDVYRTYDRLLGRKQKEAKPIESKPIESKPVEQSSGKLNNLKKMIDELSNEEMEVLFDSIRQSRGKK